MIHLDACLQPFGDVKIETDKRQTVAMAVGTWCFSAHNFTDDELLHAALIMLEHALDIPELEKWRMPTGAYPDRRSSNRLTALDALMRFLQASRAAYNDFVLYHNFRHVIDVLQAIFYFLVQIGSLPPYPKGSAHPVTDRSAIASLVKPFDALTLLISSIGHDVGHPGVNNAFLVALNAPLAQLYNDRSVLESFHCAAYSQILRRYWPTAFEDIKMRKLMINSILATDMGLHFKYMADLGNLQDKLHHNNNSLDGWNLKQLEEYRDLACGLLIKCADISNVARKFKVAAQWASILNDEFSNQGNMEKELEIPTQLFGGPPERDNVIKMAESQIGFMNIFARPLFEGVTDILPAMQFSVDELMTNKATWERRIEQEKSCPDHEIGRGLCVCQSSRIDGMSSPMTRSHTDLPETKNDSVTGPITPLSPISPKTIRPEEQPTSSRRGSGNGSMTAILITETPSSPTEHHQKQYKKNSLNPFSNSRLRSISPSKRKQRGGSSEQDQAEKSAPSPTPKANVNDRRPQSSPTPRTHSARTNSSSPPPLPIKDFSTLRPQKDAGYKHANGTLEGTGSSSGEEKGKSYFTPVLSASSATDVSTPLSKRASKFSLSRIWRKKWRAASSPSPQEVGEEGCP
jgi:3'5'-cyclic nucleotide phosphodiesterase